MGNPFKRSSEKDKNPGYQDSNTVAPPKGPPPGYVSYDPPPGPPPSFSASPGKQEQYAPPPGPPPGHFEPPPGPPPGYQGGYQGDPSENHAWMSIPDTALLPPPPSMGHDYGSKSNADLDDANRAHQWCKAHPLIKPHAPTPTQTQAVRSGDVRVMKSPEFRGDLVMFDVGTWSASTRAGATDACLITSAPLYFALADLPLPGQKKTIYFEISIRSLGRGQKGEECSIAIGYCAIPYPTWRMPGWERGSLAVHSDDGRRYVNDPWGGKDFTEPMKTGDIVGLGVTFTRPKASPSHEHEGADAATAMAAEAFFTRNGQKDGSWDLNEELDARTDLDIDGLDGTYDLFAAVGVFGGAEFDIKFKRDTWLWLPR